MLQKDPPEIPPTFFYVPKLLEYTQNNITLRIEFIWLSYSFTFLPISVQGCHCHQ